jgi:hypothetical protein
MFCCGNLSQIPKKPVRSLIFKSNKQKFKFLGSLGLFNSKEEGPTFLVGEGH